MTFAPRTLWIDVMNNIIDIATLPEVERLPGWRGRYFDSPSMTFAHYEFDGGASIHEHSHPQEEVYEMLEGEIEITIDGVIHQLAAGSAAIVPADTLHAVRAISGGRLIVVDYPRRESIAQQLTEPHF